MTTSTVLVAGATGSIGRLVVAEALRQGYETRALVRSESRAEVLDPAAEVVVGDLTQPETLGPALEGVDAVILTHGVDWGEQAFESVVYRGVRHVLTAIADRDVDVVLMSALGATARTGLYNEEHLAEWKRRAERLVRASGQRYTVVRPGWFDENAEDELQLVMRQGDSHHAGNASDGAVSRRQIAQVLVSALASHAAHGKTFELVSEKGAATVDLDPLFAALAPDTDLDGAHDAGNLPLEDEPARVLNDLNTMSSLAR